MSKRPPVRDDVQLKKWLSAEITKQLLELKEQIINELTDDIISMQQQITTNILSKLTIDIDRKIKGETSEIKKEMRDNVDKQIDKVNNQIVTSNDKQLTLVKQNTREIVLAVGAQVQSAVYSKIIGEINEKIVPQVNNMVQWVNYNMQDGGEVLDKYRRAVEHQSTGSTFAITGNGDNGKIITPHVRMFFSDSD